MKVGAWGEEWQTELADPYPDYIVACNDGQVIWQLWKKRQVGCGHTYFPLENSQADVGKELKVRYNRHRNLHRNKVLIGHKWHTGVIVAYDSGTHKHSIDFQYGDKSSRNMGVDTAFVVKGLPLSEMAEYNVQQGGMFTKAQEAARELLAAGSISQEEHDKMQGQAMKLSSRTLLRHNSATNPTGPPPADAITTVQEATPLASVGVIDGGELSMLLRHGEDRLLARQPMLLSVNGRPPPAHSPSPCPALSVQSGSTRRTATIPSSCQIPTRRPRAQRTAASWATSSCSAAVPPSTSTASSK